MMKKQWTIVHLFFDFRTWNFEKKFFVFSHVACSGNAVEHSDVIGIARFGLEATEFLFSKICGVRSLRSIISILIEISLIIKIGDTLGSMLQVPPIAESANIAGKMHFSNACRVQSVGAFRTRKYAF